MVLVHVLDGSVGVADSDIEAHRFCVQQQRMDEEINTTRMQTEKTSISTIIENPERASTNKA